MRKFWMYLWLLTKRLYKKPAFLALLVLIPLLVVAFGGAAQEESGVVTVALYLPEDASHLHLDSQLIRYLSCSTPEEAEDQVRYGKADAAWVFPEDWRQRLEAFCQAKDRPIVAVFQRENTSLLRLATEKLSGALAVEAGPILYEQFAKEIGLELSEEALMAYYENAAPESGLFRFSEAETALPVTYLTAPVRGLLAVVALLAALAAAMFFTEDLQKGTFAAVSYSGLPLLEAGCQLICLAQVAAVSLLALTLSGMAAASGRELASAALYMLCCGSFAMALRRLFPKNEGLGGLLMPLTVTVIGICPVFFDLGFLRPIQLLLPPTYYIHSLTDGRYLAYMALYTALCAVLCLLPGRKK